VKPDDVLDALDEQQRAAALAVSRPVCVLAGAGTGKTRAITHRIAYGVLTGVMNPSQVLAVTFTSRAAAQLRGRLRELGVMGVQARTFHAAALRQLQYFWPTAVGGVLPRIAERKSALLAEAVARCGQRADDGSLRDLAAEIEWAKVSQIFPDDYPIAVDKAHRQPPRQAREVAQVYAQYEELKQARGQIDFEDVLLLTVGVLEDCPDLAAAVRRQYCHFVVDEYQDVNPLQQRLLDLWLDDRNSVCVVGDPNQTIYSFTGATQEFLLDFPRRYPEAAVVHLIRDYRSTPQVVRAANALIGSAAERTAERQRDLIAGQPDGPEPTVTCYPDEPAEVAGVLRRVKTLLASGVPSSQIAVLFRVNTASQPYEQALAQEGISYLLRDGERFFDRPEVKQAVMLLRGATRAAQDSATSPGELVAEVQAVLSASGWSVQPPVGVGAARERWESLAALLRLAAEFVASRADAAGNDRLGLAEFVAELDERSEAQHVPVIEGVTLASLHAAKGLEWEAVFLVGLTEGMLPIAYAVLPEQIEEERRLLYVGITRARRHLALSWARARHRDGRGARQPSRFLVNLRSAGLPMA